MRGNRRKSRGRLYRDRLYLQLALALGVNAPPSPTDPPEALDRTTRLRAELEQRLREVEAEIARLAGVK